MILSNEEKIREYTEKGWWADKTLLDYFKEHVANTPEWTALVDPYDKEELTGYPAERVTYEQLDRAVDSFSSYLKQKGIKKDDIIITQLPNCWEFAMLYLAIAGAGGVISPVPVQWRKKELEYIANLTGAKAFITVKEFKGFEHAQMGEELKSGIDSLDFVITLDEVKEVVEKGDAGQEQLEEVKPGGNDIFTICWTSGTEAEPKGCPLSHNNWINQGLLQKETADIRAGDVLFTAGPLVNMGSVGTTFIPWLILGGTFVQHHPFNPQYFIQQIMREKVNYTLLVPAVANMIVKHPKVDQFDLSCIRAVTFGSAPPSVFTVKEFERRWNIEVGNIWGQNEGTGIVAGPGDVPEVEKRVDSLPQFGKKGSKWSSKIATERLQTKIVDPETGKEVSETGSVGELAYKGPNVMPGYFNRPDLTQKSFDEDDYFYTGDLFVIKEDDCIGFFERKKDIIIRGGLNISAQDIENTVLAYPGVEDAAAVGMPDDVLGERACIYVVPKEGAKLTLDDIVEFIKEKDMAVYKLPERLEIVDSIPRNPVGKILKSKLREDIKEKLKKEQ